MRIYDKSTGAKAEPLASLHRPRVETFKEQGFMSSRVDLHIRIGKFRIVITEDEFADMADAMRRARTCETS